MIALLSPDAPDDVASAASVKMTGPSIVLRLRDGAIERDQLALHAEAQRPELLREPRRLALGGRRIAVGHDQHLASRAPERR